MKNSGLFLNMAKWCFLVCFFEVLILLWFVFGVSDIVSKVLKNVCFSSFGFFFSGVVYCCSSGFGRFRCFFLRLFFLCLLFLFLFCLFCFCFVVDMFWVLVFFLCFCFFCFCLPPHLALNPPYLLFFVFCLFVCLFFVCFLFLLFLGGFKGQVRWPKGPPHLALNLPYFLFVLFFLFFWVFVFFSLFWIEKTVSPLNKGHFCC